MTPSDYASVLATLFSQSILRIQVPSATSADSTTTADLGSNSTTPAETNRTNHDSQQTVFYDQVVSAVITLEIPSSPFFGPHPSHNNGTVSLPLAVAKPKLKPQDGSNQTLVPSLVSALLFCLHVSVQADYVPWLSNNSNPNSRLLYQPVATVSKQHLAYQTISTVHHDSHHHHHQPVNCFVNSWPGNKIATNPERPLQQEINLVPPSGQISFRESSCVVEWTCNVPVAFVATPFHPLLSLTAALTLSTSPSVLSSLLSSSLDHVPNNLHFGFSHSLLSPLRDGPVYPDPSSTQPLPSAMTSSVLSLDRPQGLGTHLAQLGKQVLGGNHSIVTPISGLDGIQSIEQRRKNMLESAESTASSGSSRTRATPIGPKGDLSDPNNQTTSADQAELSQELATSSRLGSRIEPPSAPGTFLQVHKRCVRTLFEVKSGLTICMRTLFTSFSPFEFPTGSVSSAESQDQSSLVLCVEIENPFDSGIHFHVQDVTIRVDQSKHTSLVSDDIHVRLLNHHETNDKPTFPINIQHGQQTNLLYYLTLAENLDQGFLHHQHQAHDSVLPDFWQRNVAIVVLGHPLTVGSLSSPDPLTKNFESRWNCTLDLFPLCNESRRATRSILSNRTALPSTISQLATERVSGSLQYSASALDKAFRGDRVRMSAHLNQGQVAQDGNPSQSQHQQQPHPHPQPQPRKSLEDPPAFGPNSASRPNQYDTRPTPPDHAANANKGLGPLSSFQRRQSLLKGGGSNSTHLDSRVTSRQVSLGAAFDGIPSKPSAWRSSCHFLNDSGTSLLTRAKQQAAMAVPLSSWDTDASLDQPRVNQRSRLDHQKGAVSLPHEAQVATTESIKVIKPLDINNTIDQPIPNQPLSHPHPYLGKMASHDKVGILVFTSIRSQEHRSMAKRSKLASDTQSRGVENPSDKAEFWQQALRSNKVHTGGVITLDLRIVNQQGGNHVSLPKPGLGVILSWVTDRGETIADARPLSVVDNHVLDSTNVRDRYVSSMNELKQTTGLIPLENHMEAGFLPDVQGSSIRASLHLVCLSLGHHKIPQLVVRLIRSNGYSGSQSFQGEVVEQVTLSDIGSVVVSD